MKKKLLSVLLSMLLFASFQASALPVSARDHAEQVFPSESETVTSPSQPAPGEKTGAATKSGTAILPSRSPARSAKPGSAKTSSVNSENPAVKSDKPAKSTEKKAHSGPETTALPALHSSGNTSPAAWAASDFRIQGGEVQGFSDAGIRHVRADRHLILPQKAADGTELRSIAPDAFSDCDLEEVDVPDQYRNLGDGAFSDNKISRVALPPHLTHIGYGLFAHNRLTSIELPPALKSIDTAAFFDNRLTVLTLPAGVETIGSAAFRGNALRVLHLDNRLASIDDLAFAENKLVEVGIPLSLLQLADDAFASNPGERRHGGKVILRTPNGQNPGRLQGGKYCLINPPFPDPEPSPHPGHFQWATADFSFRNDCVTGLSASGRKKVLYADQLDIPALTPEGTPLRAIGDDAFRDLRLLRVTWPETIESIGKAAFQYNHLTSVRLPAALKMIGTGAFSQNAITALTMNDKAEEIGILAFYGNSLKELDFPGSVQNIGVAAFRDNELSAIHFHGTALRSIGRLAFDDNHLTEVAIPESVRNIDYQAFEDNPGLPAFGNKVVLRTPHGHNPQGIADGARFVIDPEQTDGSSADLRKLIAEAEKTDLNYLSAQTLASWHSVLNEARRTANESGLSQGKINRAYHEVHWLMVRMPLERLICQAERHSVKDCSRASYGSLMRSTWMAKEYVYHLLIGDEEIMRLRQRLETDLAHLSPPDGAGPRYKDGRYTAFAKGHGDQLNEYEAVIKNGVLVSIKPLEDHFYDTDDFYKRLEDEGMIAEMLAANSADVDGVSGATQSSEALKAAVRDILRQAALPTPTPSSSGAASRTTALSVPTHEATVDKNQLTVSSSEIPEGFKKASATGKQQAEVPKTGEAGHFIEYGLGAFLGAAILFAYKKRRESEDE